MRMGKKLAILLTAAILFVSSGESNWQVQASEKKTTNIEAKKKVKKGHLKASELKEETALAVQRTKYQEFKKSEIVLTKVSALSNNRIKITWNDLNVYGPERIVIYRATSADGTYEKIKTITGDDILKGSYIDSGLKTGQRYYYKVRAGMKYNSNYRYTPYSNVKYIKATE